MFYAIAVMLVLLWILSLATSAATGGFIHLLLLAAVLVAVTRVLIAPKPGKTV
jgi:hypothetical protein